MTLMSAAIVVHAQFPEPLPDHEAIGYRTRAVADPVATLNERLRNHAAELRFEPRGGYLQSVLRALEVPVQSQIAVFSKTSLQAPIIGPANPRTVFFNDSVAVGWVPGEPFVEIAATDPRQGVIFYLLEQRQSAAPRFRRDDSCLTCHIASATLGVPGLFVRSVYPAPSGQPVRTLGFFDTDHRSPLEERWGGWFVTGRTGALHMGNTLYTDPNRAAMHLPVEPKLDPATYLTPYSDIVALMVFEHQLRMTDLLVRFGWQIRAAAYDGQKFDLDASSQEIVDYMLFVDEARLPKPVQGTSGFAEAFAAAGIRDSKGRSLRDLNLKRRLMQYPCSYMIYSPLFDGLPSEGRAAIYRHLWEELSDREPRRSSTLSKTDRTAILDVLRETKHDLPSYFMRDPQ